MDGEDLAINKFVDNKSNGIYVDVGAHHPIQRSNTHLLFKKGWEGINIDINEFLFKINPNIFGVGMSFIKQKKPGPISNEIVLDAKKKCKKL